MATPYEVLLTGDPLNAIIQVYTDLIGVWFYVFMISVVLLMVYFKNKNLSILSTIGIILGTAMSQLDLLPVEFTGILYLIMGLAVAGIIYSVLSSKGE